MDVFIITGASKGIGQQLRKQAEDHGAAAYGIARTNPGRLERFYEADVTDTARMQEVIKEITERHAEEAESFTLVNNAGVIEPIGMAGALDASLIEKAAAVNLLAPIQLTNQFIRALQDFRGVKNILNISSGAGRHAYEGWSIYCSAKAGLDHFSAAVSAEQRQAEYPAGIVSIAPGIIDTGMQETIRSSSDKQFPHLKKFIAYKEEKALSSAEETAEKLLRFVKETDFTAHPVIADIRQFD